MGLLDQRDVSAVMRLRKGQFQARIACGDADIAAAQALRFRAFRGDSIDGRDEDGFDAACVHVLVEEEASGRLACCFRLLTLGSGAEIGRSYAAQFYELSALAAFQAPMVEMGRFCIAPEFATNPDVLRVAWGAMTRWVDQSGVQMLFGCSSFSGIEAQTYRDSFAMLAERHLAPERWLPKVKAPDVYRFASQIGKLQDMARAVRLMPPLLRTYLLMGGWVSDHAVVDRDLNTLHVFTGLEIAAIPPARVRLLRGVAA